MRVPVLSLFIIMLVSLAFSVTVVEPLSKEVNDGDVIDIGQIGPGQTVFVRIDPHVSTGGKFGQGGDYDLAIPINLSFGWEGNQSLLYQRPVLQVTITAAKNAPEGEYYATIVMQDTNDDKLPEVKFRVKIRITWNVLQTDISPKTVSVGPGQPARYEITIMNKGTASDVFEVSSSSLKRWQFKKYVYVAPKSEKKVVYELVENEEAAYNPVITVVSTASSIIRSEQQVSFQVSSDLKSDFKATNHGVMIMPIFESMVYSFIGFVSNFI